MRWNLPNEILNKKVMKKTKFSLLGLLIMYILSACNSGGGIEEVKLIPVRSGKDYQFIDSEGKIVINPQFSEASIFRDGLALVRTSGENPKYGFISEDGNFTISANYKAATTFSEGLAWVVSENSAPTAINTNGEIKITLKDAESVRLFHEDLAAFSIMDTSGVKWGFVNKDGAIAIAAQFAYALDFSSGKCAVQNKDGKWGYIDKDGKIVINYQFDAAKPFNKDVAVVALDKKYGTIDESGKYLINPQFKDMLYDNDQYLIEQDGKWGWCDSEGKIIINPQFETAYPFNGNDITAVMSGESFGFIDKEGKIEINPQFDIALPFNGNLALVFNGKKVGFIDKDGKYLINPQFDNVSEDYVSYVVYGTSTYNQVKTDFFNLQPIVDRINFTSPEGLTLQSKLSDVMSKFNVPESDFSQYYNEHHVIKNVNITSDAFLNLYVIANAYASISDGWDFNYMFNPDAEVLGYKYTINITGKGYGKEAEIVKAIEKNLSQYTKDANLSTENDMYFSNANSTVHLTRSGSLIQIYITKPIPLGMD